MKKLRLPFFIISVSHDFLFSQATMNAKLMHVYDNETLKSVKVLFSSLIPEPEADVIGKSVLEVGPGSFF
ncbi:MAG: hypothetical protein AB9834_23490 [Lentimicrobium sp.]